MSTDASTETENEEEDEQAPSGNGSGPAATPAESAEQVAAPATDADDEGDNFEPSFFEDPSQVLKTLAIVIVLIAAIYIAVP